MQKREECFPHELRTQVLRRGSIAQACLGTRINRQQFNKYLAGQIMPSARNLRKICAYLGVTEAQLMSGGDQGEGALSPGDAHGSEPATDIASLPPELRMVLKACLGRNSAETTANVLPNGCYDCYFPLRAEPDVLVRWLLSVRTGEHGQTFTFRTAIRESDGRSSGRAKYSGTVLPGPHESHLIGTSRPPLCQQGILAVRTQPVRGGSYFSGLALTSRADGPVAIRVALHFRGTLSSARDTLAGLGLVAFDDPDLDPVIVELMQASPAAGANWIQSVCEKNLRRNVQPGGSSVSDTLALHRLSA